MTAESLTVAKAPRLARVHFVAILSVALLLRLMVVSMVAFAYPHNWLFSKAPDLGFLAQSLVAGRGLASPFGGSTGPSAFVAPGYPLLMASLFHIFGSYSFAAEIAIMVLQTLFALLTIAILMQIARHALNAATANLAGAIWSVSPPLLWLPSVLWETSLSILLLTGMVALALRGADKPGNGYWVTTGTYCGLAMLVNPSLTLALWALLGWTVYRSRGKARGKPWLCWLALALVFAPWPVRNALVLHAFIPLRSNFGYEVWQGNHEGASGLFDATIEPLQNKREYAEYAALGEVAYMRHKTRLAEAYIRTHPGIFFRRCAARAARFFTGAGSKENSVVIEWYATVTSLLGLAGLVALLRQSRAVGVLFLLPLLLFPLPYYITHPDFRFRLVLDPLLTILTAHALLGLRNLATTRRRA